MPKRKKRTQEELRASRANGVRGRSKSRNDIPSGELTRTRASKNRTTVIEPFIKGYETHPVTGKRLKPKK